MNAVLILIAASLTAAPLAAQTTQTTQTTQTAPAQAAPQPKPLERLAREQILVLPVQYLTFVDSLGWSQKAPPSRSYLNSVDDEIAFALTQRGLKGRWTLVPALIRAVARNPGYTADPRSLSAGEIRYGTKAPNGQLQEPLGSQLRSLIALTDARYVLFPVEMRLTGSNGVGHAMLHLVIIDARRSEVQWSGDLAGSAESRFSPAIAADIASRLADLIAAPVN